MRHTCPTCGGAGISGLAKRWSAREHPATCACCGRLSHVLASTSSGIFVGGILTFTVVLIAALALGAHAWPGAVVALCLAAAFNLWAWRRAEMFPIPHQNAATAAKVGWLMVGVYGLLAMLG